MGPSANAPLRPGPLRSAARLAHALVDPTILTVPIVIGIFVLLRSHQLIENLSLWEIVALIVGAYLSSTMANELWPDHVLNWRLYARVAVELAGIGVVIYAVGWGPTLALGFLFGVADCMRNAGSIAARPAMIFCTLYIVLGQLMIALGVVPSLVSAPLVHALAGLAVVGLVFTIKLLGWVFQTKERFEADLGASERRFKALVKDAADAIVVYRDGLLTYASPAFEALLGYGSDQLGSLTPVELAHPDDLARMIEAFQVAERDSTQSIRIEVRIRSVPGDWLWFDARISNLSSDPDVAGIVVNLHDITQRKLSEAALLEAEQRFRSSFEQAPIGMSLVDDEDRFLRVNRAFGEIVGRDPETLVGQRTSDLLHPDDRDACRRDFRHLFSGDVDSYQLEHRYVHADGHVVWASRHASCVRDAQGRPLYEIRQIEDITERRAMSDMLAHAAIHDPLTDLPNRTLFMDRLEVALRRSRRRPGHVAVAFLDLDRFKLINDSVGHNRGDQVLCQVAARIQGVLRPSDTVSRFGGDEFTILCEDVRDEAGALEFAQRVTTALSGPLQLDGTEIFITASIGVALSRSRRESPEQLLREADTAMYRAKERGRASIELYEEGQDPASISRLRTGNELHRALDRHEFELHYQPIVDVSSMSVTGVEALVRWIHPTRGLLAPSEFIGLAEDTGMIVPLGNWVLREGCRQLAEWTASPSWSEAVGGCVVSINVSPRQLAEREFTVGVAEAIGDVAIDPDRVWIEITESTLMRDPDKAVARLHALRDQGVHICIDDFGTGFSSLSYLKQLPVEGLKIDRSFVGGLGTDPEDTAIVRAVIGLADSLGLTCIAEGVETQTQKLMLQDLGCHVAQGFLFGEPVPPRQLRAFPSSSLASWSRADRSMRVG